MKFTTKLYTGLGSILVLALILLVLLMNMLNQQTVKVNLVVKDLSERVRMASTIQYEMLNLDRELKELTSNPPDNLAQDIHNNIEQSKLNIRTAVESLEKADTREKSQELIQKFKTLYDIHDNMSQEIITLQKTGENEEFEKRLWYDMKQNQERIRQIAGLLYTLQDQRMKDELYRSRDTHSLAVKMTYTYVTIALFIGLIIAVTLIRSMTRNLNRVSTVMAQVSSSQSDHLPRIEVTSKDEIGAIAEAFNGMAQSLEEHAKQEKELKEKAEEHGWLKSKIAEIAVISPGVEDLQTLVQLLIKKLTPMIGAQYGIFYIKEGEGDQRRLDKLASYAAYHHQVGFDRFRFGEGLVGQCAADQQPIVLTPIPDDYYMKIASGTGMATPNYIIMLPVMFEDEVLGVIELASFEAFTPLQEMLLHEVMNHIGIAINSMINHMKVEKLLQESQALTEELQSQSEELQLQQEELRTVNEKLEEQYESSEQKKRELEKLSLTLEEKAQQLELSSQYKSEFLANMSHELRTPLNSLLILAQMLSENGDGNLTPKQVEYVRTIYSSGKDLLHLINDVLDLAKVESGKIDIVPGEVKLSNVESFVKRNFSHLVRQKGLQLNIRLDSDLPETFYTDVHRLEQILKNLLSNALKFTEVGSVSLFIRKAGEEEIDGRVIGDKTAPVLAFSVVDTGIGISREKQKLIFEAFKQADGTTSRKYGGTGLGLSISRELAELLGGFIEVHSEEGAGSSFILYLPSYQTEGKAETLSSKLEVAAGYGEERSSSEGLVETIQRPGEERCLEPHGKALLKGKRVLLVDDDMRNIFALTTALEECGIEVLFAENGREGIEALQENPDTDMVLMDIMMPEMDGLEAIQAIRKMPPFQTLPIIALTAKAMKQNKKQCLEAGASDYISKPINLDQLFSLMQVWLYR
ncbi:two-component system chemotaxis sensor kinase CheA [Bacillus fengqiuensis]|nr:two-component system chemotaxis sensor kinase CheA [Bacillus fengqiuensis]